VSHVGIRCVSALLPPSLCRTRSVADRCAFYCTILNTYVLLQYQHVSHVSPELERTGPDRLQAGHALAYFLTLMRITLDLISTCQTISIWGPLRSCNNCHLCTTTASSRTPYVSNAFLSARYIRRVFRARSNAPLKCPVRNTFTFMFASSPYLRLAPRPSTRLCIVPPPCTKPQFVGSCSPEKLSPVQAADIKETQSVAARQAIFARRTAGEAESMPVCLKGKNATGHGRARDPAQQNPKGTVMGVTRLLLGVNEGLWCWV
jgi:hypothetical protein